MALEAASVIHASRHYEQAGLRPQAFRAALTGAEEASRISARQEAFELYQRAIANMPADLPIAEQAELYSRFSARRAPRSSGTRSARRGGSPCARAVPGAGQPIEAAEMLIADVGPAAIRDGSAERGVRAVDDPGASPSWRSSRRATGARPDARRSSCSSARQ